MRKVLGISILSIIFCVGTFAFTRSMVSSARYSDKTKNVVVTGTLVQVEGVECSVMIFLNNYHLVGNLQGFGPGDTVTVTGALDIATICQQGTPLRVISIREASQ